MASSPEEADCHDLVSEPGEPPIELSDDDDLVVHNQDFSLSHKVPGSSICNEVQ